MEKSLGTKLKIGSNSIAELTSIGGLELSADTLESTTLDNEDGFRTFVQSWKDGGEVSISGYFNPSDTNGQAALLDAFNNGTILDLTILFPSTMGAEWGFRAVVTGYSTNADLEEGIGFEGTLKVTGKPSLGVTASTGLSGLVLTGAGGTLSPDFSADSYSYAFDGVTADSITVTATAAGHELKLYADGVFLQNLTSGSPSEAISLTVDVGKKLTILARESGKTTKTYEIIAVKVA